MTQQHSTEEKVRQAAKNATRRAQPWVERLARFGYATKGVVYIIVGTLAAMAALGTGGQTTDSQGALQAIVTQPYGKFLLSLVAIGLIGYVIWRFVEAFLDPEGKGTDAKAILQRLGYAISGLSYAGLSLAAVKLVLGSGGGGNSNSSQQDSTARLLAQPFGQWLVGIVGAIVVGVGVSFLYGAYRAKFRDKFNWAEMNSSARKWVMRFGRFGYAARGIVFAIIGLFLIQAAIAYDASKAIGLGGALAAIARQPFGPWLLGLVALGLVAYGVYNLVEARYSRIIRI